MHNFKNLTVWQKSIQLAIKLYKFLNTLPTKDQYIFSSQLSRCANSIPSNIAEGSGKESVKDFCRYLNIARGSSFELETQLIIMKETLQNQKEDIEMFLKEVNEIQKIIHGSKKSLVKNS